MEAEDLRRQLAKVTAERDEITRIAEGLADQVDALRLAIRMLRTDPPANDNVEG